MASKLLNIVRNVQKLRKEANAWNPYLQTFVNMADEAALTIYVAGVNEYMIEARRARVPLSLSVYKKSILAKVLSDKLIPELRGETESMFYRKSKLVKKRLSSLVTPGVISKLTLMRQEKGDNAFYEMSMMYMAEEFNQNGAASYFDDEGAYTVDDFVLNFHSIPEDAHGLKFVVLNTALLKIPLQDLFNTLIFPMLIEYTTKEINGAGAYVYHFLNRLGTHVSEPYCSKTIGRYFYKLISNECFKRYFLTGIGLNQTLPTCLKTVNYNSFDEFVEVIHMLQGMKISDQEISKYLFMNKNIESDMFRRLKLLVN